MDYIIDNALLDSPVVAGVTTVGSERASQRTKLYSVSIFDAETGQFLCAFGTPSEAAEFLGVKTAAVYQGFYRQLKGKFKTSNSLNRKYRIEYNSLLCPHCGTRIY